jgi:hypothetical protein
VRPLRGLSAALTVILLGACGPSSGSSVPYQIATAKVRSDVHLTARLDGVLNGRTSRDGTACLWVGQGKESMALFWPFGYSAGGNPLTVYDDSGKSVATVGQQVGFGGGLMFDDVHSILGCSGFTNFWGVGDVIEAQWN